MRVELNDKVQLYKGMVIRPDIKNNVLKNTNLNNKNYDQIEIRSANTIKEQRFFDKMVNKVQQSVLEQTKDEKINKLKEKIEKNQYTFDVTELVSKILIEKGE